MQHLNTSHSFEIFSKFDSQLHRLESPIQAHLENFGSFDFGLQHLILLPCQLALWLQHLVFFLGGMTNKGLLSVLSGTFYLRLYLGLSHGWLGFHGALVVRGFDCAQGIYLF